MRIAVIGSGIAGNVVAWHLFRQHDITVFEADNHVGGHTHTVDVETDDGPLAIDTGFIVFNDRNYPRFASLLESIGQASHPSEMSFSVRSEIDGFEYNGGSINGLFAQRRNLLRPGFYRMLRDILNFNRHVIEDAAAADPCLTVGEYLDRQRFSGEFRLRYLVPMAGAIWSSGPQRVEAMPLRFLSAFFDQHGLLGLRGRPQWRVVTGGSREYVDKLVAGFRHRIRLATPVHWIRRSADGVLVKTAGSQAQRFDHAFVATHSDQALALLADPTRAEREVLGAMPYQGNDAVLHSDESLLPRRRRAWAAWNCHVPTDDGASPAVTYNMNILQGLQARRQYCVTLNGGDRIAAQHVIRRIRYEHPVITGESVAAQARQAELNRGRTHFCGAYWRNGFHEDGVLSGLAALSHFEEASGHAELHFRRTG